MISENILGEEKMNSYFLCINAGKEAITLDLTEPEGKELFLKLISELNVDIFTTNQLPRNYQKLGIGYSNLKEIKDDIIWLGATGFGPDSNEPAYDPNSPGKIRYDGIDRRTWRRPPDNWNTIAGYGNQ